MDEPENHTLRLLREFREESREFRTEMREFQAQTHTHFESIGQDIHEIRGEIVEIRTSLDTLTMAIAGEIVQSRYVSGGINDRFEAIERRLADLEKAK
jgi:NifB/MoaA-like Fe-S oxidoreductase